MYIHRAKEGPYSPFVVTGRGVVRTLGWDPEDYTYDVKINVYIIMSMIIYQFFDWFKSERRGLPAFHGPDSRIKRI